MVNKVTLIGNLGGDPEVKHLESGAMVARIPLATNERYKDKSGEWQDKTEWHNIILWRDRAEQAEKILKKGMTIYVEGKITYRKYQDKDGVDKYITDIVGNQFKVVDWKDNRPSGGNNDKFIPSSEQPTVPAVKAEQPEKPAEVTAAPEATEAASDDDGLPF